MARFKVWDLDEDPEETGGEYEAHAAAAAAEMQMEDGWGGDEDEVQRVRVRQVGAERYEDFLVHVEMVPRFVASKEG